ncbi:hypothetical protein Tsubulata_035168, partial [Turnera subulata]
GQAWAALTRIGQARSGVVGSLEVGCCEFFCGCDAVQQCGFLKSTGGEGSYQGGSEDGADSFLTVTGGVGRQLVEGGARGGTRVQVKDQPVAFLRSGLVGASGLRTTERDLTQITDKLWLRFYEKQFGEKNTNIVVERMRRTKVLFTWRELYEAKLKDMAEAEKKAAARLRQLYKKEDDSKSFLNLNCVQEKHSRHSFFTYYHFGLRTALVWKNFTDRRASAMVGELDAMAPVYSSAINLALGLSTNRLLSWCEGRRWGFGVLRQWQVAFLEGQGIGGSLSSLPPTRPSGGTEQQISFGCGLSGSWIVEEYLLSFCVAFLKILTMDGSCQILSFWKDNSECFATQEVYSTFGHWVYEFSEHFMHEPGGKLSRQVRLCTKVPPSSNKRSFWGGNGYNLSNVKSNLMKKAKLDFLKSREVKNIAALKKNAVQRSNSASSSMKPGGFPGNNCASSSKPANSLGRRS